MPLETFRVQFFGICTHLDRQHLDLPQSTVWSHRVVLINASDDGTFDNYVLLNGLGVVPHHATLQIVASDILSATATQTHGFKVWRTVERAGGDVSIIWSLDSVLLSVANSLFPGSVPSAPAGIPSLLAHAEGFSIGPPDPAVTLRDVPSGAAAYFDFFEGSVGCSSFGQAAVTTLTATTLGNPQIRVTPFERGGDPLQIELRPGAQVTVANLPSTAAEDKNADFALHYLTASAMPPSFTIPAASTCPPLDTYNPPLLLPNTSDEPPPIPLAYDFATPGCSNSNYP